MTMIIDAHSHYMPPSIAQNTMFFKVNWSDVDKQLTLMDQNNIEKALLLYPTSDAHLNMGGWKNVCDIYNKDLAAMIADHGDRFIGAGILPPDAPETFNDALKNIHDLNLRAISLASSYDGIYLDDERFFPVYEFAQNHKMPIHVHAQIMNPIGEDRVKDPLLTPVLEYVLDVTMCLGKMMMEGVFLKFPDVKFIFAHYGGVLPLVKERFDTTYRMLRKREFVKDIQKDPSEYFQNLYFDTSGSRSAASLLCALEMTDLNHIVFGSDFPAN
ncbi:MAG: amidohydrolase family protein, partial [Candidatus Omnitrophica bacterium]|nr:amidohydrolase family protein [Candidatus Omnitrophota bacterium]